MVVVPMMFHMFIFWFCWVFLGCVHSSLLLVEEEESLGIRVLVIASSTCLLTLYFPALSFSKYMWSSGSKANVRIGCIGQ